jgi:3-hydroxypropanoate dehydrogenase
MQQTATAPLVAILASDHDFHENIPKTFAHFPGARDMFAGDDALRDKAADVNATLQVGFFTLAVHAAGLGSSPMTGFDAPTLNDASFPDDSYHVLAVVNIGKPGQDAWMGGLSRVDFNEVVSTV